MAKLTTLEGLDLKDKYALYGSIAAGALILYLASRKSGLSDYVPNKKIPYKDLTYVHVEGKKYMDTNGNSYWSSRVLFGTKDNEFMFALPYQYGSKNTYSYQSIHELGTKYVDFGEKTRGKSWESLLSQHLGENYKDDIEKANKKEVQEWGKTGKNRTISLSNNADAAKPSWLDATEPVVTDNDYTTSVKQNIILPGKVPATIEVRRDKKDYSYGRILPKEYYVYDDRDRRHIRSMAEWIVTTRDENDTVHEGYFQTEGESSNFYPMLSRTTGNVNSWRKRKAMILQAVDYLFYRYILKTKKHGYS